MTNAIARWHSNAKPSGNHLEQAYADKLEAEMQEMAVRLHQVGLYLLYKLQRNFFITWLFFPQIHLKGERW